MKDPRDPDVLVRPDVNPWLTLNPGVLDGPTDASIHRARVAQRTEREQTITAALTHESLDLLRQEALDSLERERVAGLLHPSLSLQDRRDAAAVAVRMFEPRWQIVSRYEAADAVLVELRKSQRAHGWYLADSDLRVLADRLAGVSWQARLRVWTGQLATSARTWTRAALGMLSITEER